MVRIPGPLRRLTAGSAEVEVEGGTVAAVLDCLDGRFPGLRARVIAPGGEVQRFINLYVNDQDVRFFDGLDTAVADGDSLSIVPAVAGG